MKEDLQFLENLEKMEGQSVRGSVKPVRKQKQTKKPSKKPSN